MPRPRVFLAYPFKYPEIERTVRDALSEFADVVVAKDEVDGSHILEKISRQMNESDVCLFDLTASNVNVVLELGVAIGRAARYCILRNVSPSQGAPDCEFFSDLKGWDHIRYTSAEELIEKLQAYVPKQLERAVSATKPTQMTVSVGTYDGEIVESLNDAAGQGGLLIPTYICSMSLAVHPSSYIGDQFSDDEMNSIIDSARHSVNVGFPIGVPAQGANLVDGIEVMTYASQDGPRQYREYYRFRRDGLFVLTQVSPDDIREDRNYVGSDRFIGFATLLGTLTRMGLFAAALAQRYAVKTNATIRVSGLLNHRLRDDTAEGMLVLGNIKSAHENRVVSDFNGSPDLFQEKKFEWTADAITQCLRLLNYPATTEVARAKVRAFQERVR